MVARSGEPRMEQITQLVVAKVGGMRTTAFQVLLGVAVWPEERASSAEQEELIKGVSALDEAIQIVSQDLPAALIDANAKMTPELSNRCGEVVGVLTCFRDDIRKFQGTAGGAAETRLDRVHRLRSYCADVFSPTITLLLRDLFLFNNAVVAEGLENDSKDLRKALEEINELNRAIEMVAVNASIEASRAGADGAGFRLIADSIKELSKETKARVASLREKFQTE